MTRCLRSATSFMGMPTRRPLLPTARRLSRATKSCSAESTHGRRESPWIRRPHAVRARAQRSSAPIPYYVPQRNVCALQAAKDHVNVSFTTVASSPILSRSPPPAATTLRPPAPWRSVSARRSMRPRLLRCSGRSARRPGLRFLRKLPEEEGVPVGYPRPIDGGSSPCRS